MVMGDFNEIQLESEKRGGTFCDKAEIQCFWDTVDYLNLRDLRCEGYPFTWSNWRSDGDFVEKRLDRVLANEEWLDMYPHAGICNEI